MTDEPRGRGRPTKYDPAYCDEIVEFMSQGYSATAYAGSLGVSRSTIDNWAKEYPDFMEALNAGKGRRLVYWEGAALRVADRGGGPGTATIITFGLKNMGGEEWSTPERVESSVKATVEVKSDDAFAAFVGSLERVVGAATANAAPPRGVDGDGETGATPAAG
jgi:transposase-like protein